MNNLSELAFVPTNTPIFEMASVCGPGTARLRFNVSPYLRCYRNYQEVERSGPADLIEKRFTEYRRLHKEISAQVHGVAGEALWSIMLDKATTELTAEQAHRIKCSPLNTFMLKNGFVEIIKNAIDEVILRHCSNYFEYDVVEIDMSIYDWDRDVMTFKVTDSGRGFPECFLEKTSNFTKKLAYIGQIGSHKNDHIKAHQLSVLFGGAGKGLRMLLANVILGAELIDVATLELKYVKPAISDIFFSNRTDATGAIITIMVSTSPLQKIDTMIAYQNQLMRLILETALIEVPNLESTLDETITTGTQYSHATGTIFTFIMYEYFLQEIDRDRARQTQKDERNIGYILSNYSVFNRSRMKAEQHILKRRANSEETVDSTDSERSSFDREDVIQTEWARMK